MASRSEKKDLRHRMVSARVDRDAHTLLELLRDSDDLLGEFGYRLMVMKYLGELRAEQAVRPLIQLLSSEDLGTRSQAADSLSKIGATEAVPELLERARLEEDLAPRTWAITALGKLGDPQAVQPLCELLSEDDIFVRQSTARALGLLGHPSALEPLRRAATRERWFNRGTYRKAIRKIERGLRSGG